MKKREKNEGKEEFSLPQTGGRKETFSGERNWRAAIQGRDTGMEVRGERRRGKKEKLYTYTFASLYSTKSRKRKDIERNPRRFDKQTTEIVSLLWLTWLFREKK